MMNMNAGVTRFHADIALSREDRAALTDARDEIKLALRTGLRALIKATYPDIKEVPTPVFYTQGSWAYKTIIRPAKTPPQQADLDYGCYLPMSFIKGERPGIASKIFFQAAESVLTVLATKKGWRINPSEVKNTCIRIEINARMHVDVPLYAIPDAEYNNMKKFYESKTLEERAALLRSGEVWTRLPEDSVLMAHRTKNWVPSDPRPIKDWVDRQVLLKTEQLRRMMRYIKAWRDWQWQGKVSPSSILLMVAVDMAMSEVDMRDDIGLLKITKRLPEIFSGEIRLPGTTEVLSEKLDKEGIRAELVEKSRNFHTALQQAIMTTDDVKKACSLLQAQFGNRFAADEGAIEKAGVATVASPTVVRQVMREPLAGRAKAG